jgi:hypothetical protein
VSHVAMCYAVRDRLAAVLPGVQPRITDGAVEVHLDGQPEPNCGEWFVSVWQGEWRGDSGDWDLSERVGVMVTVSRRVGYVPNDRAAKVTWAKEFYAVLRKIVASVHKSLTVMNAATDLLGLAVPLSRGGFVEPLEFADGGRLEEKDEQWFWAAVARPDTKRRAAPAGMAQTLTFSGALRVQGPIGEDLT